MKPPYILLFLSFILLIIKPLVASADLEATFFNVGQGNCTVVKCPEGPPLLYDAGSLSSPEDGINNVVGRIVERTDSLIYNWQVYKQKNPNLQNVPDLNFVISHGDLDHYNKVSQIIEGLKVGRRCQFPKINFILGGEENEYGKKFISYLSNLIKTSHSQLTFTSSPNMAFTSHPQNILYSYWGLVSPHVLSAIPYSTRSRLSDAKNEKSIVLGLTYKDQGLILMGDANESVEEKIIEKFPGLRTTVLLVGHHGSETATSKRFVGKTQPGVYIISAKGSKQSHPRLRPIAHMTEFAKVLDIPITLTFYPRDKLRYTVVTNMAIFNTENQGDIHLRLNNNLEYAFTPVTTLNNYVMHTRTGEKFMDFSPCESFWASEFSDLTARFDQTVKFIFWLKYIPTPEPRAISLSEFKERFPDVFTRYRYIPMAL
jgi:hypothetical protein